MTSVQAISALDRLLQGDATEFHEDAVLGFATPEDDLRASGSLARGRDEIAAAPVLRGGGHALARVGDGRDVFAEGRVGQASFVASLRLDGEGRVERGLWLSSAAVEPSPTWTGAPGADADARPILDRYFAHLEAAEFEEATACFSEDCVYLHPPYGRGGERVALHGRDELLQRLADGARPDREPPRRHGVRPARRRLHHRRRRRGDPQRRLLPLQLLSRP